MQQNAPTLKSCCKLLHWAGKAYLFVWHILLHLAGVVFVIPPGFCYVIAEFPTAYYYIWHGSCLGTLHSVAFSRVLKEYLVGVRVNRICVIMYINTWIQYYLHIRGQVYWLNIDQKFQCGPIRSWMMQYTQRTSCHQFAKLSLQSLLNCQLLLVCRKNKSSDWKNIPT